MSPRYIVALALTAATLAVAGCDEKPSPMTPTPDAPTDHPTANLYILPGAAALGPNAFGDHPLVVYKGERMRWRNADGERHQLVAESRGVPEFSGTELLEPGGEQSSIMNTAGTTLFHCTIHPQMIGTLIVQDRQ